MNPMTPSLALPLRALVDPLDAAPSAVHARHWAWPLALLCLCVAFGRTAVAVRTDPRATVARQLSLQADAKPLTEQEVEDELQMARRKALVGGVARGVLVTPGSAVLLAAILWLCGWLFERSTAFGRCLTAAAIGLLPLALFHLLHGLGALAQPPLPAQDIEQLIPSHLAAWWAPPGRWRPLFEAVDFFQLWCVALLGIAFAAASEMRRARALLLIGALYLMHVSVFSIGLPRLMEGGA